MDEEEKAFQEVLKRIEASKKPALEKKAFSTIAKLIFYNGLEQKEISWKGRSKPEAGAGESSDT